MTKEKFISIILDELSREYVSEREIRSSVLECLDFDRLVDICIYLIDIEEFSYSEFKRVLVNVNIEAKSEFEVLAKIAKEDFGIDIK